MDDLQTFLAERNAALVSLDLEWARKAIGRDADPEVLLVSLHKARYECTAIDPALRRESGDWLVKNGLHRMMGTDVLPNGELPQ